MSPVHQLIHERIRSLGPGKVFIAKDFLDLGSRDATDQCLSRLTRTGDVRRLGRGLYYIPRINQRLGIAVGPGLDEIADALARQTGTRIVPSGAAAANRLGLSTQVPARPVFLSDGRSRTVRVGEFQITIKHAGPKELPSATSTSVMVIQALRHMGRDAVDDLSIARLRKALSTDQRQDLLKDSAHTTDWIRELIQRIAAFDEKHHG